MLLHTKILQISSLTACVESSVPICLGDFYLMKKSAEVLRKPSSESIWETSNRSPNIKCVVRAFFRERFEEKDGGLRTYKSFFQELGYKIDFSHSH